MDFIPEAKKRSFLENVQFKALFTRNVCVCVNVNVCVKFCIESMVDAENGSGTHSLHVRLRHHSPTTRHSRYV